MMNCLNFIYLLRFNIIDLSIKWGYDVYGIVIEQS